MNEDFVNKLLDYFNPESLMSVLDIPMVDLIYSLEDYIVEQQVELEEFMDHGS